MAFLDRTDSSRPRGVETYRTASGRVMVAPPRGSSLKRGEVRKAVQSVKEGRSENGGKPPR